MPKVAKAVVNFIDGSNLVVELDKKVEAQDAVIICTRILGLPDGTPADKPTIATVTFRTYMISKSIGAMIPFSRINSVNIQEEYSGKEVASDIKKMWDS